MRVLVTAAIALCAGALAAQVGGPQIINAGDEPINVDIGHAAPYLYDFDGDGLRDLLVGEFGKWTMGNSDAGRLRIYRNVGMEKQPRYKNFEYFQAGGEDARVPTG